MYNVSMRKLLFPLWCSFFVAALLVASCASASDNSDNYVKVISLKGDPKTGYQWVYTGSESGKVAFIGSKYEPRIGDRYLIGPGGDYLFSFRGLEKGRDRLGFEYRRGWQQDDIAQSKTVDVVVDGDLNVIEI